MKHILVIICIVLFSVFIHGYQFGISDQEVSIPIILKSQDPSLFPGDLLLGQNFARASISYQTIGFFTKFVDIQTVFFIGYLVFQFIFFLAIYRLSIIFLKNSKMAYLSLLPFFLPKFIGGTANFTFDPYFGHRVIGLIFLIFFLIYLLEKKFMKATIVASIGILVHPLSIIPSLVLLPVFIFKDRKRTNINEIVIIGILISLPYLFLSKSDLSPLPNLYDEQWLSILKLRADYLFPSLWNHRAWLSLGLYLTLIFIFVSNLKKETKKTIRLITAVLLFVFIANYVVLEIAKIPSVVQFQLVRSIYPIAYLGLVLSPLLLVNKNTLLRLAGIVSFIALSLNLFNILLGSLIIFLAVRFLTNSEGKNFIRSEKTLAFKSEMKRKTTAFIFLSFFFLHLLLNLASYKNLITKIQFPKETNDWIDLQKWAKDNTFIESTFLVPPNQTGFRIFSQRPIVADIKDGAAVIYSPAYAKSWFTTMEDLKGYYYFDEMHFLNLKNKYNFDYLITESGQILFFQLVYNNNLFNVYKL